MIKARYIAEEYIREQKISSEKNIKEILNQYDKLNHIGIKTVNYGMFLMISIKIIILALIFLIR
jgi:hypothetical protein